MSVRTALAGALCGAGLVLLVAACDVLPVAAYDQTESFQAGENGELIAHLASSEGRPHTVVVIDPRRRALATYQLDAVSGTIALKSVRNISWDLQMIDFNSTDPLPQDIRKGLQR